MLLGWVSTGCGIKNTFVCERFNIIHLGTLRQLRKAYSAEVANLLTRRPERQVQWRELRDLAEEKEAHGRGEM